MQGVVAGFAKSKSVPVRATALLPPVKGLKHRVIDSLGRAFKRKAYSLGVATNDWFLGVLPLNRRRNEANDNAGFKLVYESTTGFRTAGAWYTMFYKFFAKFIVF